MNSHERWLADLKQKEEDKRERLRAARGKSGQLERWLAKQRAGLKDARYKR